MTKESLHNGSIFVDYLYNQEFLGSRRGLKIVNEHMLLGWLAGQGLPLDETLAHMAKSEFKRQWHLNQCYLDLLDELSAEFKNKSISPILLKGTVLLKEVYPDLGSRSMSDVDILITKEELPRAVEILKLKGFEEHNQQKWKANAHKAELVRIENGIELVVELHCSLFYHCDDPIWETVNYTESPYRVLKKEHFFLFQCTHLGFQHSFLKLFWLLDIHYWLIKNQEINEEEILKLARVHKVYNSLVFTLYFLNKYFSTPMGPQFQKAFKRISPIKKKIFSADFLIDPKRSMPQYLLIKHLCKDSLKESLTYDLGWIKDKLT
ncbi:MAG: hypothetical protein ACJAT2_001780 [Bacteriovoracaceae bacterium]|jgi:hypothetical protein